MSAWISERWPRVVMLDGNRRRLIHPIRYRDADREARVPKGFECDLASIPRLLWWWAAPDGVYRAAVILHDFDYRRQEVSRRIADRTLYRAMRHLDTRPTQALAIWLGVRIGGWLAWHRNRRALAKEAR
jgi:hypothetical protein